MRRLLPALLVASLLLPTPALAREKITLSSPSPRGQVGGTVQVQVDVEGRLESAVGIQEVTGLRFVQSLLSSSTVQRRGRMVTETMIRYDVFGEREGTFTIGPARAVVDGLETRSNTIQIEFAPGSGPPPAAAASGAASGAPGASGGPPGTVAAGTPDTQGKTLYARASVDQPAPFVGQSVLYRLEIGAAVRTRGLGWDPPDFTPFMVEPGVDEHNDEESRILDGRRWNITTVDVPLFTVQPGTVTVPATQVQATVMDRRTGGFGISLGREVGVPVNAVPISVRPLPTAGRPADFDGVVGRFKLQASVDTDELAVGETATLTLTVSGRGSLRGAKIPVPVPDSIRTYDETPDESVWIAKDGVRSRSIFRRALVPTEPGRIQVPPVQLAYFDPESGNYRRARSAPITLTVTGEVASNAVSRAGSLAAAKAEVEVLGSDILPLHTGDRMLGDARLGLGSPLILALLLLPSGGFLGFFLFSARRQMEETEGGRRRRRRRDARDAVGEARSAAAAGDVDGAEGALREWLGARLGTSAAALTPAEASAAALASGAPKALAEELDHLLESVEAARYGGASRSGVAEALAAWLDKADGAWS